MNIHLENESSDTQRKKAIILLSDGNTHLLNGPRTLEESNKELESTLKSLSDENIPVYSIGLNYDGTLDKNELEKISTKTNGKSYETNTSDNLITIISDIFSDIYKLGGTNCEIKNGDVEINIKNNSIFYANIIIQSKLGVQELNPILTSPDGKNVSLTNNDNVKMTDTGSYILIKLIYPENGKWNLHLTNADASNCTVTQLDFYSIYIKQNIQSSATVGETIQIEASLNDNNGAVNDTDLLRTITMTATVSNGKDNTDIVLKRASNGRYVGEFTMDTAGEYTIQTKAVSEKFEKESTVAKITIQTAPESRIESEPSYVPEPQPSQTEDTSSDSTMVLMTIVVVVIVAVLACIIVYVIVKTIIANGKTRPHNEVQPQPKPEPQPPRPLPPEKPLNLPKPTDPEYVEIPDLEHAPLETLIKKGAEDPFNMKAENYQADPSLEALIKKGADDPFNVKAEDYQVDPSLAALIKTGGKGLDDKVSLEKDEPPEDDDTY